MSEILPAEERVRILTNRVANLKNGSGQYGNEFNRRFAIRQAEGALKDALADLRRESAGRA